MSDFLRQINVYNQRVDPVNRRTKFNTDQGKHTALNRVGACSHSVVAMSIYDDVFSGCCI